MWKVLERALGTDTALTPVVGLDGAAGIVSAEFILGRLGKFDVQCEGLGGLRKIPQLEGAQVLSLTPRRRC